MGNFITTPASATNLDPVKKAAAAKKLSDTLYFKYINELKEDIEGTVLLPSDEGENGALYTQSRTRPYHIDLRGYPAVIVRVKNSTDVSKTVKFLRKFDDSSITVCVACGCHSTKCMLDDSFVIDLQDIKSVQVDAEALTASIGGGAYIEELDQALAPYNLGTSVGTYSKTGVGGLTLGGGYGYLSRLYGLSVDNLLEAEVVLASGEIVVANDDNEYSDLIYALRGGGAGTNVYLAPTVASAVEILVNLDKLAKELPDNITALSVIPASAPVVVTIFSYFGEKNKVSEVPELVKGEKLGGWFTLEKSVKPVSYHTGLQTLTSSIHKASCSYLSPQQIGGDKLVSNEFFAKIVEQVRKPRSTGTVVMFTMGGKTLEPTLKTSIPPLVRQSKYFVLLEASYEESHGEAGELAAKTWCQDAKKIMDEFKLSSFNYADDPVSPSWDERIEGDLKVEMEKLKGKYDPKNIFRQNYNIKPAIA
eukprot:gene20261-26304_t